MASTPTEDLLKAYEGLAPSAVVETGDGDQRPLLKKEESFGPPPQLRPSAPAAAVLAAPPSAAAPEEDDLPKAKRIVLDANDATGRKLKPTPADRCTIAEQLHREKASLSTAAAWR